jgi:hypothetical protein
MNRNGCDMESRCTLGRVMIAVALVALTLGFARAFASRRERYLMAAAYHAEQLRGYDLHPGFFYPVERVIWHREMKRKYERAARSPWLSVAPYPPTSNSILIPPLVSPG